MGQYFGQAWQDDQLWYHLIQNSTIYYAFQQEGKLVERWYMDSFTKLFNKDTTWLMNAHKNINKYIRNLILDNFGPEALKDKILSDLEDVINRRLQDWAKLPSLEVKKVLQL